jgi:transcriptional regulator NrdR family protein
MICIDPACTNGRVYCVGSKASRCEPITKRRYKCQECDLSFYTTETFDHVAIKRGIDQAEENRRLQVAAAVEGVQA